MLAVSFLSEVVASGAEPSVAAENHACRLGAAADAIGQARTHDRLNERRDILKTIVWATDGSELADEALEHVRMLAEIHGSRIVAVHANEVLVGRAAGAPVLADDPDIQEKLKSQVEELRAAGFDATLEVRTGAQPVATLVEHAAKDVDADLIVVGTHGRAGITAAVLGSVARALCHVSRRPVLVVPPVGRAERSTYEAERLTTA
jgi:nucleotide-binding universal stress UspA family protein